MADKTFDYQDYRNQYAQHVMFYEAGVSNRDKVFNAKVAVIGLGPIAIEAARLLAVAHVQLLRFIHWEAEPLADVSGAAAEVRREAGECLPQGIGAVRELAEENRAIAVDVVSAAEFGNFEDLLQDIDLVLYEHVDSPQCTLVSEAARKLRKPWIYAEACGGSGMTVSVIPGQTACIGCVKSKVGSDSAGLTYAATVTDLIARTISQVQVMEALKILGESPNISREVYCFDVNRFGYTLTVAKNHSCSSCNAYNA
jgi:molybdopterin/thiamine biosynthesis adenylyltransferase